MIVVDLPPKDSINRALMEWHRVLKPNGKLAILTPTVLIEKYDDPLTIGDFIEKHEHETIERGEHFDREILEEQLKHYFSTIEEKSFVHMTTLRVSAPVQFR